MLISITKPIKALAFVLLAQSINFILAAKSKGSVNLSEGTSLTKHYDCCSGRCSIVGLSK